MTRNSVFFIMLHVNKIVKVGGKRMIGIIGAMDEEVAKLKETMQDVTVETKASMEFYKGTMNGKDVVVVRSGIGKVNVSC